jgi:hypothetical protein
VDAEEGKAGAEAEANADASASAAPVHVPDPVPDPAPEPAPAPPLLSSRPPPPPGFDASAESGAHPRFIVTFRDWVHDYFLGDDPSFGLALVPYCFLSMVLFTRHPSTNFIFDEQEALLANPYVRSIADPHPKFGWLDAFHRDFWGLGPERSIGSYRPIPDLVWRALWGLGAREQTPFLHHWVNVLLHGMNGALVCVIAFQLTKKRGTAWLAGACFTASAVLTEAVSGVVGISDVLGATGALLALLALALRLPWMGIGVFFATLFGLYSKESALCCVPLVPATALLCAQIYHPGKPRRWARAAVAFVAAGAAFLFYVEARRRMFPAPLPAELSIEANADKPWMPRAFAAILRWYAQPSLPRDPLNNPLVSTHGPLRVAGALRVYFRGLVQLVYPNPLSGDYSAPQEPIPDGVIFPESILGGLLMVLPFPLAVWLGVRSYRRWKRERGATSIVQLGDGPYRGTPHALPTEHGIDLWPVVAAACLWIAVSYFPVSNIPVLLPTVRAERFWYFPAIGSSLLFALAFSAILQRLKPGALARTLFVWLMLAFFAIQGICARRHANDYTDDLTFWDATRKAVPRSAKAHLNYSVMKGARGDLEGRRAANEAALKLAPQWPMASIYLGDTLCRLHRAPEAWPHYMRGFDLAPNDVNLVALAIQCLWDEKMLLPDTEIRKELDAIKSNHPGSWVEYLGKDVLEHGEEHNGVDPKYRPRGYNEGPKD